jgi:hypothetical protein
MTEQPDTETPAKRQRRPKGATRKPKPPPQPHADTALVDFVYDPDLPGSPFDIDPTIIAGIARDYGFVVEWHVQEVAGKIMDRFIAARARNHWAPVVKGNFGGALDHLCDRDGYARREGQLLEGLPIQIYEMAVRHRDRAARDAVQQMKRSHSTEGVPVQGGDHPSALAKNRHRQTFEKIEIPE